MATVNLGRIKPVFRGAYNNSTAYVIDDIVTSGNETFIAIAATQGNATSDASKWTKLAAKGADGTDVAATLANKEISFKTNAGALDGIPIGNAGEFLKVNSGATGYEFGAVAGGAFGQFQYRSVISNNYTNNNSGAYVEATAHYIDITPSSNSASTQILVNLIPFVYYERAASDIGFQYQIHRTVGGTTTTLLTSSSVQFYYNGSNNIRFPSPIWYMDTPQTTSSVRYSFRFKNPHGSSPINVGGGGNVQNHHMAWELN